MQNIYGLQVGINTDKDGRMEKILLRPAEAAEAIGVSRAKVYIMIKAGELPAVRISGVLRVPAAALQKLVEEKLAEGIG